MSTPPPQPIHPYLLPSPPPSTFRFHHMTFRSKYPIPPPLQHTHPLKHTHLFTLPPSPRPSPPLTPHFTISFPEVNYPPPPHTHTHFILPHPTFNPYPPPYPPRPLSFFNPLRPEVTTHTPHSHITFPSQPTQPIPISLLPSPLSAPHPHPHPPFRFHHITSRSN